MDERGDELTVAWMTIDDKLHGHRKFVKLGADRMAATGVWLTAGSWAADHLTDGWVPAYVIEQWDPELQLAARLVHVRLWHEETIDDEDGYRFHDWCDKNLSREEIEAKRAEATERQRRSRDRRRRGNGTLGPDDGGGGGEQQALDVAVTRDGNVTDIGRSRDVTRDARVSDASVTPLPIPPPNPKRRKDFVRHSRTRPSRTPPPGRPTRLPRLVRGLPPPRSRRRRTQGVQGRAQEDRREHPARRGAPVPRTGHAPTSRPDDDQTPGVVAPG